MQGFIYKVKLKAYTSIMKYMLLIWLCSFANGQSCIGPKEYPTGNDSWYECARDAHKESQKLLAQAGYKYVNENRIATKYTCIPVKTYSKGQYN